MDSKQYADNIVKTLREPLLVLDRDHRVQSASPSFYTRFQVTVEQTVGHVLFELGNHQWDVPALRLLLQQLLPQNGEFNDFLVEQSFHNIGRRVMLLNARQLRDDGATGLILLAIEDITDRRRAELEVIRQRNWFQTTLSSIGDAVIAADAHTQVTFLNATAEKLTGWMQTEAIGRELEEVFRIINEETRNVLESPVTKALRQGTVVGLANHALLISRDGTEHPIDDSAAPLRDEAGRIFGVVLVFRDITDRRAAEKRIEVSEARYRRLFEAAYDGILIMDAANGHVLDVNRCLMDLLGHPREYFLGKQLWELGIFQDIEASKKAMRELRQQRYVRYEDLPLLDRDGRHIPVEFVCNRYHEDSTQVFQCNIRDIRRRKQLEREREALLAQEHAARVEAQASERANRAKDDFLATLSHEMRTPLNAILGWAALLRRPEIKSEEVRKGLEVIERNARAQAALIEDVLDISRVVSGKLRLNLAPCRLEAVIGAAVDVVRADANAKDIGIDVELDPTVAGAHVHCDGDRMQQIIGNLLSNAVKFCPRGAQVKVTCKLEASKGLIVVKDTGPGISPEMQPHVFERFRQADSSTTRKYGGLGLGLAIVKHLVELHGGTVRLESQEGAGSTFIVELPITIEGPESASEDLEQHTRRATSLVRLDGIEVLVVDDEPDTREVLAKMLETAGARVVPAGSAREALEVLETKRAVPDVLISDLSMPEQDGFDLIRRVRNSGITVPQLPAVALTASADKRNARRALLAGYQIHVAKPVDPNDLITIVASLTGRREASTSTE